MKKKYIIFLFLASILIVYSCASKPQQKVIIQRETIIRSAPLVGEKKLGITEERRALVIPEKTYFPDPTLGYVENASYNVFIEVWLDPRFGDGRVLGPPTFDLPPKAIVEAFMSLGEHAVYAIGRAQTEHYGWKSLGVANKKVSIDSRVYYDGHYGWKVIFRQSDFRRR
jgi:hypothetical protein